MARGVVSRTTIWRLCFAGLTLAVAVAGDTFAAGVAVSRDGRTLFVTRVFAMTLSAIDLASGQVTRTIQLDAEPYMPAASPDGKIVYVSLWGGARVVAFAADSLLQVGELPVGDHPNAMAFSNDGKRLFVAPASSASVWG